MRSAQSNTHNNVQHTAQTGGWALIRIKTGEALFRNQCAFTLINSCLSSSIDFLDVCTKQQQVHREMQTNTTPTATVK